jgi:hypothetical protein
MGLVKFLLLVVHLLAAAVWLGAMAYSLAVIQPRVRRFFPGTGRGEEFATFLAAGARWKVMGMMVLLGLTGGGLVGVEGWRHSTDWRLAVSLKVIVLLVAAGVFSWVSWRLWPARVFALPAEVAGWQRRFDLVGALLFTLVGVEFVLGAAVHVRG